MLQGMSLPTTYEVEQKAKDIKLALDYNFNEDDIEMVCKLDSYLQGSPGA